SQVRGKAGGESSREGGGEGSACEGTGGEEESSGEAHIEEGVMPASAPDVPAVLSSLRGLQDSICNAIEQTDGTARFRRDAWQRAEDDGGESRVLRDGAVFEQAGVNFSHVM